MELEKHAWDIIIEGVGMEAALQRWQGRPKTSRPIDVDWRIKKPREHQQSKPGHEHSVDTTTVYSDEENNEGGQSSNSEEGATEEEFAQDLSEDHETRDEAAEDTVPWDENSDVNDREEVITQRKGDTRWRNPRNPHYGQPREHGSATTGGEEEYERAKRKARNANRHQKRNRKRVRPDADDGP